MGKQWKQWQTSFSWPPKSLQLVTAAMKLKDICSLEEKLWHDKLRQHIQKQRDYLANKGPFSRSFGFPSSHGCEMWESDHKESWAPENWCFWTVVLGKTLESPLDYKEIKPVHPKVNSGNQPEYSLEELMLKLQYFGRLMWRPDSFEKTLMLGKIEGRRRSDRGWDGWMASPIWWTWIWANFGSWWWTGKPGVLPSVRLQRVGHNFVTEQQQK